MGTGDAPDPLINAYLRGGCDIWTAVAVDMTDEDVVDATFGFTPEEVHELERHLKVSSVEAGLVPYRFGNQKVYSMTHVLNKIGRRLGCNRPSGKLGTSDLPLAHRCLYKTITPVILC